jgi:hypothetical protein
LLSSLLAAEAAEACRVLCACACVLRRNTAMTASGVMMSRTSSMMHILPFVLQQQQKTRSYSGTFAFTSFFFLR